MTTRRQILSGALAGVLALGVLSGCASSEHTEQVRFPFSGARLEVSNPNANMPVNVTAGPKSVVEVTVTTTSAGKDATKPAWNLNGTKLDLGSPCSKGYVGICEGSFAVTVPSGTTVTVNGEAVPVS